MDIHTSALIERLPEKLRKPTAAWIGRKSANTVRNYVRDLGKWLDYVEDNGLDPLDVSRPDVDDYCAQLEARYAVATVSVRQAALSSWYAYLRECQVTAHNPFEGVARPSSERHHSRTRHLSLDEARLLLQAADTANGPQHLRDAAMVRVMLILGVRVGEVVTLRTDSLGSNGGVRTIRVTGKGKVKTQRTLPDSVGRAIDAYLESRPHTGPLFLTSTGKLLDPDYVSTLVTRLARHAGLSQPERVTAHSLRHTFATDAKELGADPADIRDAMGHADQRTTDGYLGNSLTNDPALLLDAALG